MTVRLLRRREAIRVVGAGMGAVWFAARGAVEALAASTCVLTPEQMEGPFYVDGQSFRSDVTEGLPGAPLRLKLKLRDATRCRPIKGAVVEIWHTDAAGAYSGVNGASSTFMRGQQLTNGAGHVKFLTIYPGWYPGRTTHIHVKVHVSGNVVHTGQLYFDDATTDAVYALPPYASRGPRDTTNVNDVIFAGGGAASVLVLRPRRGGYTSIGSTLVVQP